MFRVVAPLLAGSALLWTSLAPPAAAHGGVLQDKGEQTPPPRAGQAKAKRPPAKLLKDVDAYNFVKEREKRLKSREPRERKETLEEFLEVQNEKHIVKAVSRMVRDRDPEVARTAVKVLGRQGDSAKARSALIRIIDDADRDRPEVLAEAVRALGEIGYGKKGYELLRKLFNKADVKVKREILVMFSAHKEKKAFSLFVDNFDEPRPASVNSPNNPPASFWKARWQQWQALKVPVRRGLTELTGETFATSKEYRDWAKKGPGRKKGFIYKSGH